MFNTSLQLIRLSHPSAHWQAACLSPFCFCHLISHLPFKTSMMPTHNSVFTFMFLSTLVIFSRFSSTCLFSSLELSLCCDSGAMCSGSVGWCMWGKIKSSQEVKTIWPTVLWIIKFTRRRKFSHCIFLFLFSKVCERFRSTVPRELSSISEKVPFFFFFYRRDFSGIHASVDSSQWQETDIMEMRWHRIPG